MKGALLAIGSRGDVQPMAALGLALKTQGHQAVLVADAVFAPLAARVGLPFVGLPMDVKGLLQASLATMERRSATPATLFRLSVRHMATRALAVAQAALAGVADCDVIIAGGGGIPVAGSLAEAAGKPVVQVLLQPLLPTQDFRSPLIHWSWLPPGSNRLSHHLALGLMEQLLHPLVNASRRAVDLKPIPRWRPPGAAARFSYCAVSPSVVPKPGDWPANSAMVGYYFLDDPAPLAPSLEAFLQAGPPPVYLGFGSMAADNAPQLAALAMEAAERAKVRLLLATGWGGLTPGRLPPGVMVLEEAPHHRLFPRLAGAVHHGGAGTTAAPLRAGIPSVVTPVFADQPFWAARLQALGCAAATIKRRQLTPWALAMGLERLVEDATLSQRAKGIARAIARERGAEATVAHMTRQPWL
ncbi:MAG: glycosyltransferase [Candidatus Competibacterales bacterium]